MATGIAVTGERQKPTPERFAGGRLRPPKADRGDDSPAPPETKKGCFVCGTIQRGDAFTSLPDEKGIGRVVHIATVAVDGKSADRNVECLETFTTRVATAQRQQVEHEKEDLALRAHSRQFPSPQPRGFDCPEPGCNRFFDSGAGRDLHLRRGHKVA